MTNKDVVVLGLVGLVILVNLGFVIGVVFAVQAGSAELACGLVIGALLYGAIITWDLVDTVLRKYLT